MRDFAYARADAGRAAVVALGTTTHAVSRAAPSC